jgi:hypothetical protein
MSRYQLFLPLMPIVAFLFICGRFQGLAGVCDLLLLNYILTAGTSGTFKPDPSSKEGAFSSHINTTNSDLRFQLLRLSSRPLPHPSHLL